jgi:hypothetical protein
MTEGYFPVLAEDSTGHTGTKRAKTKIRLGGNNDFGADG